MTKLKLYTAIGAIAFAAALAVVLSLAAPRTDLDSPEASYPAVPAQEGARVAAAPAPIAHSPDREEGSYRSAALNLEDPGSAAGPGLRALRAEDIAAFHEVENVAQSPGPTGPNGATEGIKIHGRWVIEVREPGGKLLSRHEFDNALTDDGADLLAQMFTRQRIAGALDGSPGSRRRPSHALPQRFWTGG